MLCTGTGKITPFDNVPSIQELLPPPQSERITAQNLRKPGFETGPRAAPVKRTEEHELSSSEHSDSETEDEDISVNRRRIKRVKMEDEDYEPEATTVRRKKLARHSEVATESEDSDEDDYYVGAEIAVQRKRSKKSAKDAYDSKPVRLDDGDEKLYQRRLKTWIQSRRTARGTGSDTDEEHKDLEEWEMPHPTFPDEEISGGEFRLPGDIHPSLFPYQKVCVQWLWELRCQKSGGILSDEMVRPPASHRGPVADICYRVWGRR